MMIKEKIFEFEGADLEDAMQKATESLKVSKEDLNVQVVCEESKGLFGMKGAKSAKIRVSIKKK